MSKQDRMNATGLFINKFFEGNISLQQEKEMYLNMKNNPELFHNFMLRQKIDKALDKLNPEHLDQLMSIYREELTKKQITGNKIVDYLILSQLNIVFEKMLKHIEMLSEKQKKNKTYIDILTNWLKHNIYGRKCRKLRVKAKKELLTDCVKEENNNQTTNLADKNLKLIRQYILAACIGLMLIFVSYHKTVIPQTANGEALFNEYYEFDFNNMYWKKSSSFFMEIQILVFDKKYDEAKVKLEQISDETQKQFNKAILFIEIGDYENAIICFEYVKAQRNVDNYQVATWYLGLAYLKTDRLDKARMIFAEIANSTNMDKKKEAKNILKRIAC